MEKTSILDRVKILIGEEKPFVWASKVGIAPATFSRLYNEGGQLKTEALVRISEITGCSIDWLLTGEGPMKKPALTICEPAPPAYNVEEGQPPTRGDVLGKIIAMLAEMPVDQQRDVLRYTEKEKLLADLMAERKRGHGGGG